jgi:cardiolipin synthase A/B
MHQAWQETGKWLALFLLAPIALAGCKAQEPKITSRAVTTVPTNAHLDIGAPSFVAEAAYIADGNLYLHTVFADGASYGMAKGDRRSTPVARIEHMEESEWQKNETTGEPVPIYGPSRWHAVLNAVQTFVTPSDSGAGAVMDIAGEQELFYYSDDSGSLRTVPMVYKPDTVRVEKTYRLDRVVRDLLPQIQKALPEKDEQLPRRALLTTGDDSDAGYPFVFLDFEHKQARFLRSPERKHKGPLPVETGAQAAAHITLSHVRAVYQQPVTSVVRLFTLVTRTTGSLIDTRKALDPPHQPIPPITKGPGMDLKKWEEELDKITNEETSYGKVSYLIDGEKFFPRLVDTVSAAKKSVRMRMYIFDNDDYAVRIADLLKRRSNEGVGVRIMVDGLGTIGGAAAQPEHQPAGAPKNVEIVKYLRDGSKVKVKPLSNPWFAGDHVKVIIVDDRTAFSGGMNIGREYRYEWHDMMVELTGPVVDYLRDNFEKVWVKHSVLGDFRVLFKVTKPVNPRAPDDYPIRILRTDAQNAQILRAQIAAIRAARQRIYIQNAYFTSDTILYELAKARRRGVDVRVILPYQNDSGIIDRSNAIASNWMMANGIRVYIYPGMSHLKGAIYDGWACLGSANFDAFSLYVNKELNIATSHPATVEEFFQRVFVPDFQKSVELKKPFPKKWHDFLIETLADRL